VQGDRRAAGLRPGRRCGATRCTASASRSGIVPSPSLPDPPAPPTPHPPRNRSAPVCLPMPTSIFLILKNFPTPSFSALSRGTRRKEVIAVHIERLAPPRPRAAGAKPHRQGARPLALASAAIRRSDGARPDMLAAPRCVVASVLQFAPASLGKLQKCAGKARTRWWSQAESNRRPLECHSKFWRLTGLPRAS
jgi:hypothetical protein